MSNDNEIDGDKFVPLDEKMEIMNDIMDDDYLPLETRDDFFNYFLEPYAKDRKFQEETNGKYILFLNKKYKGIYETLRQAELAGKKEDDRYIYRIGIYSNSDICVNKR
jgi:hypothetical protein